LISRVWSGDEPVNQPWGYTTVTVEPLYNGRHWHTGIDIGSPACKGKALFAARAGRVSWLSAGILGISIPGGQTDWYVHGEYVVVWNQQVAQGQHIGAFGNVVPRGGASTGPHLHFEVQPAGGWINVPTGLNPVSVLAPALSAGGGTITGGLHMDADVHAAFVNLDNDHTSLTNGINLLRGTQAEQSKTLAAILKAQLDGTAAIVAAIKAIPAPVAPPATDPQVAADLATVAAALRKLGQP
jgi:hypothetical protein